MAIKKRPMPTNMILVLMFGMLVLPALAQDETPLTTEDISSLRERAEQEYKIGLLYFEGNGVPEDFTEARRWYQMAAAQGHQAAQNRLGELSQAEAARGETPSGPTTMDKLARLFSQLGSRDISKAVREDMQSDREENTRKNYNGQGVPIESRIDGEFEGWEGETTVKLMNGQIWLQTEYHYHYHYAYMPEVLIYSSGSGYKMKVDGVKRAVGVRRIN
jgi:hypothetical protein